MIEALCIITKLIIDRNKRVLVIHHGFGGDNLL